MDALTVDFDIGDGRLVERGRATREYQGRSKINQARLEWK